MPLILLVLTCLLLGACSSSPNDTSTVKSVNKSNINNALQKNHNMQQDDLLFYLLRKEFSYWRGTPYRLGGNSKKGIDCSAFVKNIYRDSFNIKLPRTTKTQVDEGYLVYKNQLQMGDLVFFKTGWRIRHVGIYIGNNQFIHASTSKGVIISSLNNVYWKKKYWQARRIIK
jgi:cell wall-associated NlpC family hydrolase